MALDWVWGTDTIKEAILGSDDEEDQPAALPQSPIVDDASKLAKAKTKDRRLAASRSRSIYTSPLGIGGQAQVAKKTLLGQ